MSYFANFIQNVRISELNSSTDNLNAYPLDGYEFVGTGDSTLGVVGIQVSLKTDQNCTVLVEQSPDNMHWDIFDEYDYYASINNFGVTVQAVNSYVRVVVKNLSTTTATTYFRLQTALCPIVEAVPRSLTTMGRFKSESTITDNYGFDVESTPMGELRTITPVRLVGTTFEGTTVDVNFWTVTNSNGGTSTQACAELSLDTGTTANGSTKVNSVRRARYVSGSSMRLRAQIRLGDTGTTNNIRRWGVAYGPTMPTIVGGAYFELNGNTFSIVTLRDSVPTVVSSGSFNGVIGSTHILNTNIVSYEIYWTNGKVYFIIGDVLLHTVSASTDTWACTMNHHIYLENTNSGGSSTNVSMKCRVASISRLGDLRTESSFKYINVNGTYILKYSAGVLHKIISNQATGACKIYDNTAASGTIIGAPNLLKTSSQLDYDAAFSNGLTIVTSGGADITVIYE